MCARPRSPGLGPASEPCYRVGVAQLVGSILAEHLDEAEYLVGALGRAFDSPSHTLDDVADGEEERLLAHVDGLVVAGPGIGASLLEPALLGGPPERAVAAAMVMASADDEALRTALLDRFADCPPELLPAWAEGLARAERLADARLLAGIEGAAAALCLGALALRGVDVGPHALAALDRDTQLGPLALLVRAQPASPARAAELWPAAEKHPDPAVVAAALEVALLAQDRAAWAVIRRACRAAEPLTPLALEVAATIGRPEDVRPLASALEDPRRARDAVFALGFAGLPELIPALLAHLDDPALNPLVGEAYGAITGFDTARAAVPAPPAAPVLPPLEQDDLDADLRPSRDDALDPVDPAAIRQHWAAHQGLFSAGQRHLRGRPLTSAMIVRAVREEPTRRRACWARELWLRTQGRTHVAVRAPTARQKSKT